MRLYRSLLAPATAVVITACADEAPTAALGGELVSSDLALVVPTDIRTGSIERNVFGTETRASGPARSEDEGYGTYYGYETETIDAAAGIWNAQTRANFVPGKLSVIGSHDYVGNKGLIETRASLSYDGSVIGTDNSSKEDSYPFLWPPWDVHSIWTEARVFTDRECGLNGWGDSLHKAWWEAVLGGPSVSFSEVHTTSNSDRAFQPDCAVSPTSTTLSNGTTSSGGGGETTCYLWITYDIYTGEIYDQQLLYCTDGG